MSTLSVLMVGVADEVVVPVRGVTRLFVRVSVVALPTSVSVAAGRVRTPEAAAAGTIFVVPEVVP